MRALWDRCKRIAATASAVASRRSEVSGPFKHLFILLTSLVIDAAEFFRIPVNRIVELASQIEF